MTWSHPLFDGEKRKGYPARIQIGDHAFEGFIGYRWKRFFVLVDDPMIAALGIDTGDDVAVEAWPRPLAAAVPARSPTRRAPAKRPSAARTRKKPARCGSQNRVYAAVGGSWDMPTGSVAPRPIPARPAVPAPVVVR